MSKIKPCQQCPFIRGSSFESSMCYDRAREIADSLIGGGQFSCHKTTRNGGADGSKERFCIGALGTMENEDIVYSNQMVRINDRLGLLPVLDDLDNLEQYYDSLDEWVESHDDVNIDMGDSEEELSIDLN